MCWWPTTPLPFPITQRSPMVTTGPFSTCSGDTPAESVAFGPMMHPSPSSIEDSPNNAPTGKQIALRRPNRANRRARR